MSRFKVSFHGAVSCFNFGQYQLLGLLLLMSMHTNKHVLQEKKENEHEGTA